MGLDLALIPIQYHTNLRLWYGGTRIQCDRDYDVFAQIPGCHYRGPEYARKPVARSRQLGAVELSTWTGDEGWAHVEEDPYGTPLEYILAGHLAKVNVDKASPWNQACFAFIRALPKDTPVVLWWS